MSKSQNLLVTTVEAAAITGKSWRTVIRLVERGQLTPAQKLPGLRGAFLFNRADVDALAVPNAGGDAASSPKRTASSPPF